jgi:hypothetical protein
MRFGLHLTAQHPDPENRRERLGELLEHVRLAHAVGLHSRVAPHQYRPAPLQRLQPRLAVARARGGEAPAAGLGRAHARRGAPHASPARGLARGRR